MLTRRSFFAFLGGAAVAPVAAVLPAHAYPRGVWVPRPPGTPWPTGPVVRRPGTRLVTIQEYDHFLRLIKERFGPTSDVVMNVMEYARKHAHTDGPLPSISRSVHKPPNGSLSSIAGRK